jgi:NAD(P)H-dependent flavin oxidoreductase YrpB (nitropropane dioxygenase family)
MKRIPFKGLLGWKLPIIQAPMAGSCDSAIAIAVSNAGGLGSLPCASLSAETIRKEVHTIRAATNNPFNINFFCHTLSKADTKETEKWLSLLSNYYKEFGLDQPDAAPTGTSVVPFNEEMADLVLELKPPIISFHFGLPAPELLEKVKARSVRVCVCLCGWVGAYIYVHAHTHTHTHTSTAYMEGNMDLMLIYLSTYIHTYNTYIHTIHTSVSQRSQDHVFGYNC